ncbi:MAG: DUF885 domain-containing protein [Acidobacteria bacterium]|nr:DUF885 domain-containing protein [Acidobacteriota bacterium]
MKKAVKYALRISIIAAAIFAVPTIWFKPWSINHFYARVFIQYAARHPMLLSQLRILEPLGIGFHSDDLDDVSVDFALRETKWAARQLRILHSYDRAAMTPEEKLSYDVLDWYMTDSEQQSRFLFHNYPVNQLYGLQTTLPDFMITTHQINEADDAEDYLERLSRFGTYFDQTIEGLRHRERNGIVPPKFVLEKSIAQMKSFSAQPPEKNPLYTHLEEKLTTLDAAERSALLAQARGEIERTVYPAYQRLVTESTRLAAVATTDDGFWKLPDGDAAYQMLLRHHTTTEMTAAEIHELGLTEVAQIQAEMRSILEREGLEAGEVGAAMARLGEDARFLYPDTDEGRQSLLSEYQAYIDDIDSHLASLFDLRPKSGVAVKRMPQFREADSPAAYYDSPPFDSSKPGVFFVNLRNVKEHPKFGMRTLAYHEAIPGHHFQIAIAQEQTGVPFFRKIIPFTAFQEGWALYAERLAAENGFEEDPFDRLGYLTGQLFRAVRLVVDTGIHSKRWTRERAIEYMRSNTGMAETDVIAEIERYIVDPGQACAYKVGQLKILQLRQKAMDRLGSRFDPRPFHRVVIGSGALPLTVLERLADEWIASVK